MLTIVDPGLPIAAEPRGTALLNVDGVYVKLECTHPCGSIKDRIAHYILEEAANRGDLKPGQPIVEATSGNTGIAFAYYGKLRGHPVTIVMPEHMTEERKRLIRSLGANLVLCSKEGSFAEAAQIRDRIAAETGAYNPNQFANPLNTECHETTTAAELIKQLQGIELLRPAFVAGVGTGGTLIGIGGALKAQWPETKIYAVEPTEAAVMSGETNEAHGIFGIGDGFIPDIAGDGVGGTHPMIDGVIQISTAEAMAEAKRLETVESLCIGVSSGANFLAAQKLKGVHGTVITVFADGAQKYSSAGLQTAFSRCPLGAPCHDSVLAEHLKP